MTEVENMEETQQNRQWVVRNRLSENSSRNDDSHALLYYKTLLEAELEEVRQRLVSLGLAPDSLVAQPV